MRIKSGIWPGLGVLFMGSIVMASNGPAETKPEKQFMKNDPAVKNGVMRATPFPFRIALPVSTLPAFSKSIKER
jgi:hypothetical protein